MNDFICASFLLKFKEFQVLSAEYDKVKTGRRNDDESEQDSDENEDENNYAGKLDGDHLEDVSSLSEEEDDEYEREKKKVANLLIDSKYGKTLRNKR